MHFAEGPARSTSWEWAHAGVCCCVGTCALDGDNGKRKRDLQQQTQDHCCPFPQLVEVGRGDSGSVAFGAFTSPLGRDRAWAKGNSSSSEPRPAPGCLGHAVLSSGDKDDQ